MDSTGSSADAAQAHVADGEEDDIWQGALEATGVEECGGSGGPPASGEHEGDIGGDIGREAGGELEGDIGGDIGREAASEVAGDIGGDIGREAVGEVAAESLAGCSGGLGLARSPVLPHEVSTSDNDWGEWGGADWERAEDVERSVQHQEADVPAPSQEADTLEQVEEVEMSAQVEEVERAARPEEIEIAETVVPMAEAEAPMQEAEAPAHEETVVPVAEAEAPMQEAEAPVHEETVVPVAEAETPMQQAEAPVHEETVVPVAEAETPMQEAEAPAHEERVVPVAEAEEPMQEAEAPEHEEAVMPMAEAETPMQEAEAPAHEEAAVPVAEAETPTQEAEAPAHEDAAEAPEQAVEASGSVVQGKDEEDEFVWGEEVETPEHAKETAEAPVHAEEEPAKAPAADAWDAWDDDDDWETAAAPSVKTGRQILDTWCKDAAQTNLCPLLKHLQDSPKSTANLDNTLQGCIPADMHRFLTTGDLSSQTTASALTGVGCGFADVEDCIDGALSSAPSTSAGAVRAAFFATLGKYMQLPPGQDPSRLLSSMAAARDDAPDRVKAYLANLPDLSHLYSTSIVTN